MRPDAPVLKGVDMQVDAGKVVAIVGPSGGGKSTLFSLLLRFYDVDSGSVFVNSIDVRDLNLNHFRSQCSWVAQDPVLYNVSLRDNIAYGISATDEQIRNAAHLANLDEFVSELPEGLDTLAGRRGSHLSGGQRQRVAIARALLRNPKILLLDEATSALDNESERLVKEALATLMKNRTTLLIAHRLSTVRSADEIVVMADGRVVERGSHAKLMAENGVYASLVHADGSHEE
jgi:ATP-binding cassette subfamily B protein